MTDMYSSSRNARIENKNLAFKANFIQVIYKNCKYKAYYTTKYF